MSSWSSENRVSLAFDGTFQLTPAPKKKPFFVCAVNPNVARVMFSVFETVGGKLKSKPRSVFGLLMVAVSSDGRKPFNSPVTRNQLREGKPTPAPQRSAPPGVSKSS